MSPQKSKNKQNNSNLEELELETSATNLQNKRQSLSRNAKQQSESKDVEFKTLKKEMLQFFAKAVGLTENGRFICDLFHELPRRKDYPDYYKAISRPICLDMIKTNIESDKYDEWSFLFEDFELLVNNAKEYNMPESEVYEDAVTIDKFCKSYPSYQKPSSKTKKKVYSEYDAEELAKQQQNPRSSKRDRQSILQSLGQDSDESSYPKAKKSTSTNKKSIKSVLELMAYISKHSDTDFPYDFYIPLPKDINQAFPTKLDGIPYNWTLLHCAAYNGHKGLVDHLINLGADKEEKDDYFGSTPLIWAAYNGQYETCELLIENHGANTKAQNTYGQYPLDISPDSNDPKWIKLFSNKKKSIPRKNELLLSKDSRENTGTPQGTPKAKQSKDSDSFQSGEKDSNIPDFSRFSIEEPSANHFVAILTRYSNAMKTFLKEFLEFAQESGLRDIVKSLSELPSFVRPHVLSLDLTKEDDLRLKSYLEIVRSPVDVNMIMNLNRTIRNFDFLDFQVILMFDNAMKASQIVPEYNVNDIVKIKDLYEKYRDKFRNTSPGKDIPSINDHRNVTDYISVSIRGVLYGLNDFVFIRDTDYIDPIIIQIIKITKNGDKYYLYGPKFLSIKQINSAFPLPENTLSNSLFRLKSNIANSEDNVISLCFVDHVKNINTIPINLPIPQNMVFYCSHRYGPDSKSPFLPIKDWRNSSSGDIVFHMAEGRKPVKTPADSEFSQNSGIIQHNINNPSLIHAANLHNFQTKKSSTPSKQPSMSIPGQNLFLNQMQAQLNPFGINQAGQSEIPLQMNPLYNAQHGLFSHQSAMYQQPGAPIPPEMLNPQLPVNPAFAAGSQQPYKLYSNPAISAITTPTGLPYSLHQSSISPQIPMSNLQTPQTMPQNLQTPMVNPMSQQFLSSPNIPQTTNQFMKPRNYIDPIAQQQQQFQLQQQILQNRSLSQQEQLIQRQQLIQQQRFIEQQARQQALQNPSIFQQPIVGPNQMNSTAALELTQISTPNTMSISQLIPEFAQPSDPNLISAGSQDNSPYISQLSQPPNPNLSLKNTENTPSPIMQNGMLSPVPSPSLQLAELIKKNTSLDFITSIEIESLKLIWDLNITTGGGNNHFTITVPSSNSQVLIKCNLIEPRLRQLVKFNASIRSSTVLPLPSGSDKLSVNHKNSICISVPLKTGLNPIKFQATLPKLFHSNGQEINYSTEVEFGKYQWVWPKDQEIKFTIIINRLE